MLFVYILLIAVLALVLYLNINPEFGGKLSSDGCSKNNRSERWNGKVFRNYIPTGTDIKISDIPAIMSKQFFNTKDRSPRHPLPITEFDGNRWNKKGSVSKFIWYGHSVLLFKIMGKNIMVDPMFGPDASSIAPVATKRFSEDTLSIIDQLPDLDVVIFTHDHYDHLDYKSVQRLKSKVGLFIVPLGFSMHLMKWGVKKDIIKEMDWYENTSISEVKFTFTPSRHYSGRGLFDRAKSLWGGWIIESSTEKIYISGDGGYGDHFKKIGEKYGPFDLSFVECGQYNDLWKQIHLNPYESIEVIKDVRSSFSIPIHWGGFVLAHHNWDEPPIIYAQEALKNKINFGLPLMGEIYDMNNLPSNEPWFINN